MRLLSSIITLSSILLSVCNAYRILAVFPMMTTSHFIVFEAVIKTLAKRGHQVDVVSHYPQKNPIRNYNDIISLKGMMRNPVNNYTIVNATQIAGDMINVVGVTYGNHICDFMAHEKFQKLVKKPPADPPYDLVITQVFGANCYLGLGSVLKVPVVAVASAPEFPWISYSIGNAENLASIPHIFSSPKSKRMSFWERLANVFTYYRCVHEFNTLTEEYQTAAMKKYLDPSIPNVRELERNVSLLLVNTHPVINGVKPITSAVVQIAGLHIEVNEEKLPIGLKKWLDESTSGVVYFTLGSMVLIESLPPKQIQGIYASFRTISPIRVLMKIGNDSKLPSGLPKNVKTMPWIPQQPLLAHPNVKIFITHGGLGSTQEALYFGIPMIGIPLFSDQFGNVDSVVSKGMSVRIDLKKISERTLSSALDEILNNATYKKNAILQSKLFRDNPMSQAQKAIFWIEYVIRNGGDSLKSPALQYYWFQLILLDIYIFLTLAVALIILVVIFVVKLLYIIFTKNTTGTVNVRTKKSQ